LHRYVIADNATISQMTDWLLNRCQCKS